jgi:hypothetical protein
MADLLKRNRRPLFIYFLLLQTAFQAIAAAGAAAAAAARAAAGTVLLSVSCLVSSCIVSPYLVSSCLVRSHSYVSSLSPVHLAARLARAPARRSSLAACPSARLVRAPARHIAMTARPRAHLARSSCLHARSSGLLPRCRCLVVPLRPCSSLTRLLARLVPPLAHSSASLPGALSTLHRYSTDWIRAISTPL